ncbi:hypothetical protein [Paractinoplanes lichenicola]|uniref:HNH endonuclease n=1 Tax=Paractinoplanes lichenicola TaxID=2802976 RepID=A0ABS1VYC5_9ACTN|nr:hypothetical protein [Actinoplanes lichenicola]MBL7259492.1 hypothetical protein [Actinoplanes lichenicola]
MPEPWVFVVSALGAIMVVGFVQERLDEKAARLGRTFSSSEQPWPRRWRWLCRTGRHSSLSYATGEAPCAVEFRCTTCGDVTGAGFEHLWGEFGEKDPRCVATSLCVSCDKPRYQDRHRETVVKAWETPDLALRERFEECAVIAVCEDCESEREVTLDHDHTYPGDRYRCGRCGWVDDIGE